MEPSRPRTATEHRDLNHDPALANPFRGTPPWQRGSGWRRGLAGLGAVALTAGSIAGVAWLAFRDTGGEAAETATVLTQRCQITEADDANEPVAPMDPGAPADRSMAVVQTSYGEITVLLWGDVAPCGVEAFTYLAGAGFYDSHACDRLTTQAVDPTAILRCGSPGASDADEEESDASFGPGWRFEAETGMAGEHVADVLALVTDERGRAGGAFALIRGTAIPTEGVSVIGGIVDGYEVLDQIAALTDTVAYDGAPPVPVEIWGVQVIETTDPTTGTETPTTETPTATPSATATTPADPVTTDGTPAPSAS